MLALYLTLPEIENDKISQRTKDGMRRAKKEGCFMAKAPFGYSNIKVDDKKSSLEPNKDSEIVRMAFEEVGKGIESVEAIRNRFKREFGLKLEKQQFYNMLKNVVYCGLIIVPEFKKEPMEIVNGLHEPIVDQRLFYKVQGVLLGRKKSAKLPTLINDDFPIKKNLICPICGNQITGSKSKGNGGYYEYYHCRAKCKVRYKKNEVHSLLQQTVNEIALNQTVKKLYKSILTDYLKDGEKDSVEAVKKLYSEQETLNKMLDNAEDNLNNKVISPDDYRRMTERYFGRLKEIEKKLLDSDVRKDESKKYVAKSVDLLCDMGKVFNHMKGEAQASFLRVIFPENLIIENGHCRTNSENKVIELLSRVYKDSESMEMKKATPKNGFSTYAPPLGLEPRTL